MTSTYKQLQVKINGETHNDIMIALDEVMNKIEDTYLSGFGGNETGDYEFEIKEVTITEPTKPNVSQEQSIGRTHREMTETTLYKETIKFLIESLKEDPEYTEHPYSEYDRGRKSGIGYVIWKLTQQLQND